MKYERPSVQAIGLAVAEIQSCDKEIGSFVDSHMRTFTTCAYEADE